MSCRGHINQVTTEEPPRWPSLRRVNFHNKCTIKRRRSAKYGSVLALPKGKSKTFIPGGDLPVICCPKIYILLWPLFGIFITIYIELDHCPISRTISITAACLSAQCCWCCFKEMFRIAVVVTGTFPKNNIYFLGPDNSFDTYGRSI